MQRLKPALQWHHTLWAAVGLGLCLALPLPGFAQAAAPQTSQPQAGPTAAGDLPFLLLVIQRPANAPVRRDDPNTLLKETLSTTLTNSGRFQVITCSPTLPLIKRAILEHSISASDLIEPIKQEALQRLAHTIGASTILTVAATLDKSAMKTDVRLQQSMGQQDWQVVFADQMTTETTLGKRHLKTEEVVDLTVDQIAARMSIPSHLSDRWKTTQVLAGPKEKGKPEDKKGKGPRAAGPDEPKNTGAGNIIGPPSNPTSPEVAGSHDHAAEKTNVGKGSAAARPGKTQESASAPTGSGPRTTKNSGKTGGTTRIGSNGTDAGGPSGLTTAPNPISTIPPPPRSDYQAIALRFRQTGDLANAIVSLRHAINERPRDMELRRLLVQMYQERKMPDAARAEISRALQFGANDSSLHRLYGDTLLLQGDVPGALKAYRDATHLDPGDILAQVALGDALLSDNQYTAAFACYDAAARSDPKNPLPHRRMARAYAIRAASDPTQYTASLARVKQARSLIPVTDTQSYQDDYFTLMTLMESRLRDMLDELQTNYQAKIQVKRTDTELLRIAADLKERAEAAADYLENLPAAAGQDATHGHYQLGAALLIEAIGHFRSYVNKGGDAEDKMKGALVNARRELTIANKRLAASRAVPDSKQTDATPEKIPIHDAGG
jgi:tetratricopeptide (TPR) repeat protein